jgi:hypothetical protein
LRVLEAKINLFELVVGELDMILGRIEDEFDFESHIFSGYVKSRDDDEFEARIAELGDELAHARGAIGIDHGRIDPTRDSVPIHHPLLRVGALVTYTLDDRFTEREEIWVDVAAELPVEDAVRAVIVAQALHVKPDAAACGASEIRPDLARAATIAHTVLDERAARRAQAFASQAQGALREERSRVEAYYDATLKSIAKRRDAVAEDRRNTLDAQTDVVEKERRRRLHEIEAKFQPVWEIKPFRLHLVLVPALALTVDIRRGERRYPLALHWLLPASRFMPLRCPACRANETLVAGRFQLGCRQC